MLMSQSETSFSTLFSLGKTKFTSILVTIPYFDLGFPNCGRFGMRHISYDFISYRCWPNKWKVFVTLRIQGSSWQQWQRWQHRSTNLGTSAEDQVDSKRLSGKDAFSSSVHDFSCSFPSTITWPWLLLYIYTSTLQYPWPNREKPYLPCFTDRQQRHSESQSSKVTWEDCVREEWIWVIAVPSCTWALSPSFLGGLSTFYILISQILTLRTVSS